MLKKSFLIFILIIIASSFSYAECENNEISPKIACAKEGDLLAGAGEIRGAIREWQKSCHFGLKSSCLMVQKYMDDRKQYYKDYRISSEVSKCVDGEIQKRSCVGVALGSKNINPSASIRILHSLCNKGLNRGCYELGEIYFSGSNLAAAQLLFQKSCARGSDKACGRLDIVNFEMDKKKNRMIARRLSEMERRQKIKNKVDYFYRLNKAEDLSDLLLNSAIHSELN